MNTEHALPGKNRKSLYIAIEKLMYWNLFVDVLAYGTLAYLFGTMPFIIISYYLYRIDAPIVHFVLNTVQMTLMVLMMCGFLFISITVPITFLLNLILLLWALIRIVRLGSISSFTADLPWNRRQLTVGIVGTLLFYLGVALFVWILITWWHWAVDFSD